MSGGALVPARPEDFPPAVHDSLAALRRLAVTVKSLSEWQATGRRATPDEIALAHALQATAGKDYCQAPSQRTGLPCFRSPLRGGKICYRHGGNIPQLRAHAETMLIKASSRAAGRMIALAQQSTNLPVAQKAAADILDRAEVGALVKAKVQQATGTAHSGVVVQIGFLSPDGTQTAVKIDTRPTDADTD